MFHFKKETKGAVAPSRLTNVLPRLVVSCTSPTLDAWNIIWNVNSIYQSLTCLGTNFLPPLVSHRLPKATKVRIPLPVLKYGCLGLSVRGVPISKVNHYSYALHSFFGGARKRRTSRRAKGFKTSLREPHGKAWIPPPNTIQIGRVERERENLDRAVNM